MDNNIKFYSIFEKPFVVDGLLNPSPSNGFRRVPDSIADCMIDYVKEKTLHTNTAGGRVRFCTDAKTVTIKAKLSPFEYKIDLNSILAYDFDLYRKSGDKFYYETNFHSFEGKPLQEEMLETREIRNSGMREYILYFPCYGNVYSLEIGLPKEAKVEAPSGYNFEKPIVFAGSSITQGAAACRPGLSYVSRTCRNLNCDFINLGFAGSFQAEEEVMNYIASLPMCAFVYDYDHNAPDLDFLKNTHEPFFAEIREKFPNLPVVFMTKPDFLCNERDAAKRRNIIYTTYSNALSKGDRNVYFIDGETLFRKDGVDPAICTFDGCHPNDLGFWCMARSVADILEKAFKRSGALCE